MKEQISQTKIKVEDTIETELKALGIITHELSEVQDDTKRRIFEYLRSKFRNCWPSSPYND